MSFTADKLFELLPAVYRLRDAEQGSQLAELLAVIAEQVAALEENLEQLYDDQFIETGAEWTAPYIGDLIGYRSLHGVVPGVASPRADVANTIRYRRRKGTAAMLEQLAHDVTGWPARAVEFFQLLGWTQYMNHRRPDAWYAPDLRQRQRLIWLDTAFDSIAHSVDVRRVSTAAGRYNIPNIGLFLWRLRAFSLTQSPAPPDPLDPGGGLRRFDPLAKDLPLFAQPRTEDEITHLAEPFDVPMPLPLAWMAAHLAEYYGADKSVHLELAAANPGDPPEPVPLAAVCVCDLSDVTDGSGTVIGWAHVPPAGSGRVAIDPIRGRIAFGEPPAREVLASFHYGAPIAIGGGEYERGEPAEALTPVLSAHAGTALQPLLDALSNDGGAVEIADSGRYEGALAITVTANTLAVRAASQTRPLVVTGDVALDLGPETAVIIEGLVIDGTLQLPAFADDGRRRLVLRHCTLVPGPRRLGDGSVSEPDRPCLVVAHPFTTVEIEHCIVGAVHVVEDVDVVIRNSIVDATAPTRVAFRRPGDTADDQIGAGGHLHVENSTLVGKVHATELHATNTLFVAALAATAETWKAPVWVERRQTGCVRFSYVPLPALTPRRFHCQPEEGGDLRRRPHFTSLRFGDPAYGQLSASTADQIRRGADDESEMGALHDLFQPQRETNLRVRLDEYLRFGLEAGIFYAT